MNVEVGCHCDDRGRPAALPERRAHGNVGKEMRAENGVRIEFLQHAEIAAVIDAVEGPDKGMLAIRELFRAVVEVSPELGRPVDQLDIGLRVEPPKPRWREVEHVETVNIERDGVIFGGENEGFGGPEVPGPSGARDDCDTAGFHAKNVYYFHRNRQELMNDTLLPALSPHTSSFVLIFDIHFAIGYHFRKSRLAVPAMKRTRHTGKGASAQHASTPAVAKGPPRSVARASVSFEELMLNAPDAIIITNRDGMITFWNTGARSACQDRSRQRFFRPKHASVS